MSSDGEPGVHTLSRLSDIPAEAWDAQFDSPYPFIRHAFLAALEHHGCVGGDTGWEPCHQVLKDRTGSIIAAMPMYQKQHSYGEFVFDFAWAQASAQIGRPYYPKRVVAIPFTPVSGPRLGGRDPHARRALLEAVSTDLADDQRCSSTHILFGQSLADEMPDGWLRRHDVQFHWHNRGYTSFEGFLATLTHSKRQKIRRERRRCTESGLRFEARQGEDLREDEWATVHQMYANTYLERGQLPYLSLDFFLDYGRRRGSPLRLILAYSDATPVAVAILLAAGDTLYGRHWGCTAQFSGLHFETCYYQGIELCLREGYMHFDAGTQGGHKQARGFEPTLTESLHRLADPRLHLAVARFLERERDAVHEIRDQLAAAGPYRASAAPDA